MTARSWALAGGVITAYGVRDRNNTRGVDGVFNRNVEKGGQGSGEGAPGSGGRGRGRQIFR